MTCFDPNHRFRRSSNLVGMWVRLTMTDYAARFSIGDEYSLDDRWCLH